MQTANRTPLRGLSSYRASQVVTASPHKLVSLLFSGAICSLEQASEAIHNQRRAEALSHLTKARRIVAELMTSVKRGSGPMAENLVALYGFVLARLASAGAEQNPQPIGEALKVLTPLGEACASIAEAAEGHRAAQTG